MGVKDCWLASINGQTAFFWEATMKSGLCGKTAKSPLTHNTVVFAVRRGGKVLVRLCGLVAATVFIAGQISSPAGAATVNPDKVVQIFPNTTTGQESAPVDLSFTFQPSPGEIVSDIRWTLPAVPAPFNLAGHTGCGANELSCTLSVTFTAPSLFATWGGDAVVKVDAVINGAPVHFVGHIDFEGDVRAPLTNSVPAALPLFGTGLGALGLLGWRRKRKAQAAA